MESVFSTSPHSRHGMGQAAGPPAPLPRGSGCTELGGHDLRDKPDARISPSALRPECHPHLVTARERRKRAAPSPGPAVSARPAHLPRPVSSRDPAMEQGTNPAFLLPDYRCLLKPESGITSLQFGKLKPKSDTAEHSASQNVQSLLPCS